MKNSRVFVSGGSGVIGLELVPKLVSRGAIVMVGDLKPKPESFDQSVVYRQGDLNEMTVTELAGFYPDVIIHLAATFERSEETYEFWEENFLHNISLSHHLMTLAKDLSSIKRFVFASSYLIYDPALYQFRSEQKSPVSLKESDNILPRNLTGMAKLAHEIEIRFIDQYKSMHFTTVSARIYRGYGRNSRDVISRWIRLALLDKPLTVFRPEGVFDYIYAADTAEGLIRLAYTNAVNGIINLGTGKSRKVQDVIDILYNNFPALQVNIENSLIPYEASQADMTLFHKNINWLPEYDLERSIPEIIEFERSRLNAPNFEVRPLKILVTSASKKIPMIKAVKNGANKISKDNKIITGDINNSALSKYFSDEFWLMPKSIDENINKILAECAKRGVKIILPTRDGELSFWSKNKSKFLKKGISIIVSSPESIARCLDKLEFSEFGKANKLSFISSSTNIDHIDACAYVVKERYGAGSESIGINLNSKEAIAHSKKLKNPIFQPFVAGIEISIDAWLTANGSLRGLVLRKRDLVENGESQITTTFSNANIAKQATACLEALNLSGPVVMQAIITKNNQLMVIECNSRFGGASTTSIAAGLDVFYWSFQEALGVYKQNESFNRVYTEIKQIRVPSDTYEIIHDTDL